MNFLLTLKIKLKTMIKRKIRKVIFKKRRNNSEKKRKKTIKIKKTMKLIKIR